MNGLILDDDHEICEYIASALAESGVEYEIFGDPVEALDQIGGRKYDFAFIDINLPRMDGLEFCRRFKERFPEADVVFVTGYGDYEKAVQAIKLGTYDYLKKPLRSLDIRMCLGRIVEKRRLQENQKRMALLEFSNDVALELMHEIRNPVAAIGGFSRLLHKKCLPDDKIAKFADIIFNSAVRLERVLKEILVHIKAGAKPKVTGKDFQDPWSPEGEDEKAVITHVVQKRLNEAQGLSNYQDWERREEMAKGTKSKVGLSKKTITKKGTRVKKKSDKKAQMMSQGIEKKYLKSKKMCMVTFKLPNLAAPDAKSVHIVGDFNDWDTLAHPMKRTKNGDFTIKLELNPGKEYQFRYLINQSQWENDWQADKYVKTPFGDCDNSVVFI